MSMDVLLRVQLEAENPYQPDLYMKLRSIFSLSIK